MKILIVTQYFWPEYFRINDLVEELSKKKIDVEVLTGEPNYPEGRIYDEYKKNKNKFKYYNGCKINRVPIIPRGKSKNANLVINYLSFLITSIFIGYSKLKKKKFDYIFTYATSPIHVALISILLCKLKNAKHVIWVQDLWPNVLKDLNIVKSKSLFYLINKKIVEFIYNKSDFILCQSMSFKKEILSTNNLLREKLHYIPAWPEDIQKKIIENKNDFIFDNNFFNIVFAGNIGEAQNFKYILNIINKTKDKKIIWHIIGKGRTFGQVSLFKKENNLSNLILHGKKSFEDLQYYYNNCESLLISLKYNKTFNSTIPGKFQTYLKYKKKIIGIIGGETAYMINKYKVGVATKKENNQNEIFEILDHLLLNKHKQLPAQNYDRLLKLFSKERLINKIIKILRTYNEKLFINLKLISEIKEINFSKNFILSGLNLAFLGFIFKKSLPLNNIMYVWPDGYFKKKFLKDNIIKKPGRQLIAELDVETISYFKRIVCLGSIDRNGIFYLENKFKGKEIISATLPFGEKIEDFKDFIPHFGEYDLCIMTLPTPKQEIVADYIRRTQKHCKIICTGGAINMLSGTEKPLPDKFKSIFFAETLWRLKYDTKRRFKRLIRSFYYYVRGEIEGDYKNIRIINEKE